MAIACLIEMSVYLLANHRQAGVTYVQHGAHLRNNIIIMCVTFFMMVYFKLVCLEVLVWYLVRLRPKMIENHWPRPTSLFKEQMLKIEPSMWAGQEWVCVSVCRGGGQGVLFMHVN